MKGIQFILICPFSPFFIFLLFISVPRGCPRGSSYDFNYNEEDLNRLRSWISLTAAREGDAGAIGNEGKAGGDGEGATEMGALRTFADCLGNKCDAYKTSKYGIYESESDSSDADHELMDGVVTTCAGGAIVEIHWGDKDLCGCLPEGGLNMPKLRVLDLSENVYLTGEASDGRQREIERGDIVRG